MSAVVERILQQIGHLAPDDAPELFADLQRGYFVNVPTLETDAASNETLIEAEWDIEIDARLKQVEEGTIELIAGIELRHSTDELFAQLGLSRPA